VSDELVEIKTPEGKGTNMYSQFVTQIKDQKMKKNYEAGIEKLSGVKPSTQNNVQQDTYTIKGKKYTLKQLQDMGYSESDVAPYKD
jgi:hypothetical protein